MAGELAIHSSNGEFTADADGSNVRFEPGRGHSPDSAYRRIRRFDVDEYFRHYDLERRDAVRDFDVLDLGYWLDDGTYSPPEADFRRDVAIRHAAALRFLEDVEAAGWRGSVARIDNRGEAIRRPFRAGTLLRVLDAEAASGETLEVSFVPGEVLRIPRDAVELFCRDRTGPVLVSDDLVRPYFSSTRNTNPASAFSHFEVQSVREYQPPGEIDTAFRYTEPVTRVVRRDDETAVGPVFYTVYGRFTPDRAAAAGAVLAIHDCATAEAAERLVRYLVGDAGGEA